MRTYCLYFVFGGFHIGWSAVKFEAADDPTAIKKAQDYRDTFDLELWRDDFFVAKIARL